MGEWIQLRHATSHDQLERGLWYPVLDRTRTGMVRVSLNGGMAIVHTKQVRLIDHEPETATRLGPITLQEKSPGGPVAMMEFTAICPRSHEVGKVRLTASRVTCPACGIEYEIEDEAGSPGDTPRPS